MNTKFIEAFVWVARLKSFRAAAEKLYVSQATISSRIAQLETDFNCILFDRKHNDISLTDKGLIMLDSAERVLHATQSLQHTMDNNLDTTRRLRIGFIESVVHTWLDDFLAQLRETYPKIELELTAEPSFQLHALFAKGALDIIIQAEPILDETVINTELESLEIVWVCCANNELAKRAVTLAELGKYQVITFTRGSQPHLSTISLFEKVNTKPSQIHCVTSISIISKLVQNKLGIATLPLAAITEDLESDQLAVINCPDTPERLKLFASWQKTSSDLNTQIIDIMVAVSKVHSKGSFK
ncbi:LysR family transcriptional regulator [Vibrio sp. RC27]